MVFSSKLIKAETEADSIKLMYNEAVQLLRRSKSDLALEKLFHLKEMVQQSDSLSNNIIISIAEGYRQRQEYKKGLELLYELLNKPGISALVKINAWNRIAALHNEGPAFTAKLDSVIKYSNLCIDMAESNGFTEELAVSQNELGYVYGMTSYKDYPKARVLLDAAFKNFRSLGASQNAVNVAINLGSLYVEMNDYHKAHQIIDTAMNLCNEADNKNLFNRVYFLKSQIYAKEKNFRKAYEFMAKSRQLNNDFYNDRLNEQIFEMAAKFETEKKELENLELRKNNEIQVLKLSYKNNAIAFLSIGLIIAAFLLLVIFLFLRRKTIAYQKLVE